MKKTILVFLLSIGIMKFCYAQCEIIEVEAKGIFSEIEVDKHNETIKFIQSEDEKLKKQTLAAVLKNPNNYNPPLLYALSRELFLQGELFCS